MRGDIPSVGLRSDGDHDTFGKEYAASIYCPVVYMLERRPSSHLDESNDGIDS